VAVSRVKKVAISLLATAFLIGGAAISMANPSPPTNGGNGGGQSGQCTGSPADRPAVCPGT
jgi:hypothetical protein